LGFKVTSKDGDTSEFRKSFNWIIPLLMYYLLASLAFGFAVIQMSGAYLAPGHNPQNLVAISVSLFWIIVIMWQMWPPIGFLLASINPKKDKPAVQEERV